MTRGARALAATARFQVCRVRSDSSQAPPGSAPLAEWCAADAGRAPIGAGPSTASVRDRTCTSAHDTREILLCSIELDRSRRLRKLTTLRPEWRPDVPAGSCPARRVRDMLGE